MLIHARIPLLACIACLFTTAPALAGDGIRLEVDFIEGGEGQVREHATIWLSRRRLRIEQRTPGLKRSGHTLIYRGDQDRLYSLDTANRAYVDVERRMMAALGLEMRAARREVDSQLARLPKDQHAIAQRLLALPEPRVSPTKTPLSVVASDRLQEIGGRVCRGIFLRRAGVRVGEGCVVSWAEIGVSRADLEVFRQLANFQRELMGANGLTPLEIVPNQPLDILVQFDGFPMYLKLLQGGLEKSSIRVTAVEPITSTAGLFEPPRGYARRGVLSLLAERFGAAPPPAGSAP